MGLKTFPDDKAVPSQTGNSGKYLTTNGSTASWGTLSTGGMTLLGTGSMAGVTSYTFSSISQSYLKLYVRFSRVVGGASTDSINCRVNGTAAASGYYTSYLTNQGTALTNFSGTYMIISLASTGIYAASGGMEFHDYTSSTSTSRTCNWNTTALRNGSFAYGTQGFGSCNAVTNNGWDGFGPITSIQFYNSNGNNFSDGTIYLYGVK